MDAVEFLQKFWMHLLVVLGLGTWTMFYTGAWLIPSSGVYSEFLPNQYDWAHYGSTQRCVFEVHSNLSKTINSVSFKVNKVGGAWVIGDATTWVAGTRDNNDWLIWRTAPFTTDSGAQATYNCTIRIVQNENPGTSETIVSRNFTTIGFALLGCEGQADCNLTTPTIQPIASNPVIHRRIYIGAALSLLNSSNVIRAFLVNNSGSISFPAYSNLTFDHVDTWFSGSGKTLSSFSGNLTFNYTRYAENQGIILLFGHTSGAEIPACFCSGSDSCNVQSPQGEPGGALNILGTTNFSNSGSLFLYGGDGISNVWASGCCGGLGARKATIGGIGGTSGFIYVNNASIFKNNGTINANSGVGGSSGTGCSSGGAGAGRIQNVTAKISFNSSGTMTATGLGGSWNISACAFNYTGTMLPSVSNTSTSCYSLPSPPSFSTPNVTSTYTTLLENITAIYSGGSNYELWFSQNNGTNWTRLEPPETQVYPPNLTASTYVLQTHRLLNGTSNKFRLRAYNSTSFLYSEYVDSPLFNLTYIPTSLVQYSVPNGTVSTNSVTFICNYTNSTNAVEMATARILLDGVLYNLTYNYSNGIYYYVNTDTLIAGNHNWSCQMNKSNYAPINFLNSSLTLSGFGVYIAGNKANVSFTCPFPTITGMVPAGQRAGVGALRVQNFNTSSNKSYSIILNNSMPAGIQIFARCDRYVSGSSYSGWNSLSTSATYLCMQNVTSSNSSAYFWLRMDCVSATPGYSNPFGYIIVET